MTDDELLQRIVADPANMVGKPVVRGTRLPAEYIVNLLACGTTEKEIIEEYKGLTSDDIRACVLFDARQRTGR